MVEIIKKGERTVVSFNEDNTYNVVNSKVNDKQIINLEPLDGQELVFLYYLLVFFFGLYIKNGGFSNGKNEIDAKLN